MQEEDQTDGEYIMLDATDISNDAHNIISLDDYIKADKTGIDYSDFYLFISCRRSSLCFYRKLSIDLYKDEKSIEDINSLIINFKGKRIYRIHDIHDYTFIDGYEGFKNYCKNLNINLVIGNYIYNNESKIISAILKNLGIPYCVIPNLINDTIFKDYGNEKIYDILIYGSMGFCYILRKRMLDIIKRTSRWKSRIISFNELTGAELSKEINKSYLSVSTCSTFEYLVCKYIEIPLSGSLVIGNMPEQGKSLFSDDDFIHVTNDMTDQEIIDIVDTAITNKADILHKIKRLNDKLEFFKVKYLNNYLCKCIDFLKTQLGVSTLI